MLPVEAVYITCYKYDDEVWLTTTTLPDGWVHHTTSKYGAGDSLLKCQSAVNDYIDAKNDK